MTPQEHDATDLYEERLERVEGEAITEPKGSYAALLSAVESALRDPERFSHRLGTERLEAWQARAVIGAIQGYLSSHELAPGAEQVDPSVVERVKGMGPLDGGEE